MTPKQYTMLFKASPQPFLLLSADSQHFTCEVINDAYRNLSENTGDITAGKNILFLFPEYPSRKNDLEKIITSLEFVRDNMVQDTIILKQFAGMEEEHVSIQHIPLLVKKNKVVSIMQIITAVSDKEGSYAHHEELMIANKRLALQNKEKNNRAAELIIAKKELAFQNKEKDNRAAELLIANKELDFQNEEKENRASELVIANKKVVYQHNEKKKRASELVIANKELAFQNQEKEDRASELVIANEEVMFQNKEKKNRASELLIANKELAFQNQEKEKRAAELALANKELAFQNEEKEKRAIELININSELKKAQDTVRSLNEDLEQKVINRTAQLLAANAELESFSYSVSHDLRSPLRAIHGYARMLKEKYDPQLDAEGKRLMNNILANSKKMGSLIDELLTFSRLGRKELVTVNIPMQDMVTNICDEIRIEESGHDLQFIIKNLPRAKGDINTIKQVWVNLISNAVKYSRLKEKAIVEIGAETKGDEIEYHIKDNGAGFDMRYADKLFGVFQRLHSDDEFEGIGVGLAIVHRIISKHGGKVWAVGKLDEGATFYFTLKNI